MGCDKYTYKTPEGTKTFETRQLLADYILEEGKTSSNIVSDTKDLDYDPSNPFTDTDNIPIGTKALTMKELEDQIMNRVVVKGTTSPFERRNDGILVKKNRKADADRAVTKVRDYYGLPQSTIKNVLVGESKNRTKFGDVGRDVFALDITVTRVQMRGNTNDKDHAPTARKQSIKYETLYKVKQEQLVALYNKLSKYKKKEKQAETAKLKHSVRKMVNGIKSKIEAVKEEIDELKITDELGELTVIAKNHMAELANIFSQEEINFDDVAYAKPLIAAYIKAGTISEDNLDEHIFLTDGEVLASLDPKNEKMYALGKQLQHWRGEVENYKTKIERMEEDMISKSIDDYFDVTPDLKTIEQDKGFFAKMTLDLSMDDQAMIQYLQQYYKRQNFLAEQEHKVISDEINDLYKEVLKSHDLDDVHELFHQQMSNDDTRKTGNLVGVFSQKFYEDRKQASKKLYTKSKAKKNVAIKEYVNWLRTNQLVIDVRKVVPNEDLYSAKEFNSKEIEAHKKELLDILGEYDYNLYITEAEKQVEDFKLDREDQLDQVTSESETEEDPEKYIRQAMFVWDRQNSPYYVADSIIDGTIFQLDIKSPKILPNTSYVKELPKQSVKGKDTGYYDSNYKKVMTDPALRDLHTYIRQLQYDLLNVLPESKKKGVQINTLPTIQKTIAENFNVNNLASIPQALQDKMTRELTSSGLTSQDERDAFGELKKDFYIKYLHNNKEYIEQRKKLKSIAYQQETGKFPSAEIRLNWEKDIINDISNSKSQDIGKNMKAYAHMVLTYKHRAAMEEVVIAANNIVSRQKTASGDNVSATKQQLEFFQDNFYMTDKTRDKEGISDKKLLSAEEKKVQKETNELLIENTKEFADGKITEEVHDLREVELNNILNDLGSNLTGSSAVNALLKYVQFKNMGWNFASSIANVSFGLIAGTVQANSNNYYDVKAYSQARRLGMSSIMKSATFNTYSNPTATKTRNWMDKLNVLHESKNEIFQNSETGSTASTIKSKFKWASPYNAQARGEYLVQSIDMNALALSVKVTKGDESVTLFDIMNEDGSLKEGWMVQSKNGKKEFDPEYYINNIFIVKLGDVIAENHGNYDPDKALLLKKNALGRSLSQFRTWMFEGYNQRMGYARRPNDEYFKKFYEDETITRKGRYRTGLGLISYVKKEDTESGMDMFQQVIVNTKYLMRKLIPGVNNDGYLEQHGYAEHDARNIQANIQEMLIGISLMIAMMMLEAAYPDEEDEHGVKRLALNMLINQGNRAYTDIAFYANPLELESLSKNTIPAFSVLDDVMKFSEAVHDQFGENPVYRNGKHKDWNKAAYRGAKMIPLVNGILKLHDNAADVYKATN